MADMLAGDTDGGISILVDLARATDENLRKRARALAASLLVPVARTPGVSRPGGSTRIGTVRSGGVDLDIDATIEKLVETPALGPEDLQWRGWRRPSRAVVLVVDASGSVSGEPLATAIIAAAALAARLAPSDELGVVAFWSKALVLRHLGEPTPPASVIERLLVLRTGDTTDMATGIRAGLAEVATASAARKDVIVVTDGLANEGDDPCDAARAAIALGGRLHVLALPGEEDSEEACKRIADAGGGSVAVLQRPSDAVSAIRRLLEP